MNVLARWLIEVAQGRRCPSYWGGWSWTTHPVAQARINRCVSGDPGVDVYEHLRRRYGHRVRRVLDLGCGGGAILRNLHDRGIGTHFTGIDVSEVGIRRARELLPADRAEFLVADLNAFQPSGRYDLVVFWYALHHIQNLEGVLARVRQLLAEGGLLFVYDFFGPTRWQWTEAQLCLARTCLAHLPLERRRYHTNSFAKLAYLIATGQVSLRWGGWFRTGVRRQPAWLVSLRDPSESVRSGDMYSVLTRLFEVVEEHATPGGVISLVMDNIVQNMNDEEGHRLMETLLDFEEYVTEKGFSPVMNRWMMLRNRA